MRACTSIEGLDSLLREGTVLILGELHGTEESPDFLSELACHALASDLSVTIGLELLDREADAIQSFLASSGSEADRRALVSRGSWSAEYQDGRTSAAILELLDRIREWRSAAKSVTVELFDRSGWRSGQERDRLMAKALEGIVASSGSDLVLVLTGNIHSRITRGTRWDASYEPMTHLLAARVDRELLTLDVAHAGGSAWMCTGSGPESCGARNVGGRGRKTGLSIEIGDDPEATGHHGRYQVGPLTASPPAAEKLDDSP